MSESEELTVQALRRVCIITSGYLPVPNVLGGAVEALDMMLLRQNEQRPHFDFTVYSIWAKGVEAESNQFHLAHFSFIKTPLVIKFVDLLIFFTAKYILHKKKLMSYRYIAQRLWYIHRVAKYISRTNYEAVIIENHATLFMTMKQYGNALRYRNKVYYHLHNELTNGFGCLKEISSVHKVLGVSHFIVNSLDSFLQSGIGVGLNASQIAVWKNCVDTDRFNPANDDIQLQGRRLRKKLKIADDATVFLFSGRLTEEKGAKELLQAFLKVNDKNAVLAIAGAFFFHSTIKSPFEQELEDIAKQAGDRIKFTGFVDYKDMPALYAMSDICCLPSMWNDPAPLAVIESLASGRPLITTRSGGIPEYADTESAVILERDANLVDNLARAMESLSKDVALRQKMGRHGRKIAEQLSSTAFLDQFIDLTRN